MATVELRVSLITGDVLHLAYSDRFRLGPICPSSPAGHAVAWCRQHDMNCLRMHGSSKARDEKLLAAAKEKLEATLASYVPAKAN